MFDEVGAIWNSRSLRSSERGLKYVELSFACSEHLSLRTLERGLK